MGIGNFEHKIEGMIKRGKLFHGFAVVDRENICYKKTYQDYSTEALHPVYSITKSITVLLGLIALDQHGLPLDSPCFNYLEPGYRDFIKGSNPEVASLTWGHLCHMQTGFIWPELVDFGQSTNIFTRFLSAADSVGFVLEQAIGDAMGRVCNYNSGASHLLGYCISQLVGMPLEAYAERVLFKPIGVLAYQWERDGMGRVYGGHGLSLSLDSLCAIAQMMAGEGSYKGTEVVKRQVVHLLLQPQVKGFRGYSGYGFGMWHVKVESQEFVAAFGHGGQRLYWSPNLGQVLVFLGKVRPEFGLQEQLLKVLLQND